MSEVLQAVGAGVLLAYVSPGFAKGLRVGLGCTLMLVGVAVVAVGLSGIAK